VAADYDLDTHILLQSRTLELAETDGRFPSLTFDSMTGKMGMRPATINWKFTVKDARIKFKYEDSKLN
jgi:hypothetical protein